MARRPPFSEEELRRAVATSRSYAETLRHLGRRTAGNNNRTVKKYIELWRVPTHHFDPAAARAEALRRANRPTPLEDILVENSTFHRGHLKKRLYTAGVKQPRCELCGQGEVWRGRRMSLILDHINGVGSDNRIGNLRVVCPNCAATLDTHCGRNVPRSRACRRCGLGFEPRYLQQFYCSRKCGVGGSKRSTPRPRQRKVERPPYEQLIAEIEATSYLAVGRKYGVSDNAIRKWVRWYEREREAA